jgi:hypothetical protein
MFRAVLGRSFFVVLCGTSLAMAQDPPPLEAPASEPDRPKVSATESPKPAQPAAGAVSAAPNRATASAPPPVRPMLVIPGVTAPAQRPGSIGKPKAALPSSPANSTRAPTNNSGRLSASPPVVGSPFRPTAPTPGTPVPEGSSLSSIPLTLEPLEDDPPRNQTPIGSARPRIGSDRPSGSITADESDQAGTRTKPAPWRLPGVLGRIMNQSPATTPRDSSARAAAKGGGRTRTEPETDADVKRRIEREIRTSAGDRLQSVDVRVSGKNVVIVARPARFWQKRGLRRTLESLTSTKGYRARIDVDD